MALHKAGVCVWLHLWVGGMHFSGSLPTLVPMHLQSYLHLLAVCAGVFVALFWEQVQGFKVAPAH